MPPHARTRPNLVNRRRRRPSPLVLIGLLLLLSCCLGLGLAQAMESPRAQPAALNRSAAKLVNPNLIAELGPIDPAGGVDVVPDRYQAGQEIYLKNCASCHIGIPPAVLPSQTWQVLIQDEQHYGVVIKPVEEPDRRPLWQYLQTYSRPLNDGDSTPYRIASSSYFRALHPGVKLPEKVQIESCAVCHPGVSQFNFRQLSPAWATP
jgi:mono/diheme cytochrome c family protein